MGASTFITRARGTSATEAFDSAVKSACHDYGHSGYTGSIAEKRTFVMVNVPVGVKPIDHARALLDSDDRRISDKWGPAGCIACSSDAGKKDEFIFFGWAPS